MHTLHKFALLVLSSDYGMCVSYISLGRKITWKLSWASHSSNYHSTLHIFMPSNNSHVILMQQAICDCRANVLHKKAISCNGQNASYWSFCQHLQMSVMIGETIAPLCPVVYPSSNEIISDDGQRVYVLNLRFVTCSHSGKMTARQKFIW